MLGLVISGKRKRTSIGRSCNERLPLILANSLLEDTPRSVTGRLNQYSFAIRRPCAREIVGFVVSQPPGSSHTCSPGRELAHVNLTLRRGLLEHQPPSI